MKIIWPKAIKNNAVEYDHVEFNGNKICYAILAKSANVDLPGFVGCFNEDDKRYFFISEEVPVHFRNPQILHEIIEIQELAECPGSCLKSLEYELNLIPTDIQREYFLYRRNFFRKLVSYCKAHSQWYSEQRIKDMQDSLEHLEVIAT